MILGNKAKKIATVLTDRTILRWKLIDSLQKLPLG